ncbi:hypothetical protein ACFWVM_00820 [Nocardia fluminea]|uniref:hypothetical protein n=1 Tax=Nocardia fluminea TaxID=134984 RepID=UPI00365F06A8
MWTAIVGALAIVVSTFFNIRTLKRSRENLELAERSIEAAEERARVDRDLAHQQRLREAIADVMAQGDHWAVELSLYARMLDRYAAAPSEGKSSAEIAHAQATIINYGLTRLRPAGSDLRRVLIVADLLTRNQELLDRLRIVRNAMQRVSAIISDGSTTKSPDQVIGLSKGLDDLREASNTARGELYEYATERLPKEI